MICKDVRERSTMRMGSPVGTRPRMQNGSEKASTAWSIGGAFVLCGARTFFVPQHVGHE
jgi:hypothetical protein